MNKEFINELKMVASLAPEFNDESRDTEQVEKLANKYCEALDNNDENLIEIYSAALILKFWSRIRYLYEKTRGVSSDCYDDFVYVLKDRIDYACRYRTWQKEGSKTNAQACINQAINTEVQNIFGRANWQKNKANSFIESLDEQIDGESDQSRLDLLESDYCTPTEQFNQPDFIIQNLINDNKVIEAIFTETISYNDCSKHKKKIIKEQREDGSIYKYTQSSSEFWPYRVIQLISNLSDNYFDYFKSKYKIKSEELQACLKTIKNSPNQRLYQYLDATQQLLMNEYF